MGIELRNESRRELYAYGDQYIKDKGIRYVMCGYQATTANRSTANKRVDMRRMNHNIVLLNQVEGFNSPQNEYKRLFEKLSKTIINDINYWDLLGSLYTDYYAILRKYGEGVYDRSSTGVT